MQQLDLFRVLGSRLNKAQLRYMITGAAASIILRTFPIDEFCCPPSETIQAELQRTTNGHFNIIHHKTGFKVDIYLAGQGKLNLWGLEQKKPVDLYGETFWLAPIEYVILKKLEYYREGGSEKHLRDIIGMMTVSGDQIDFKLLDGKAKESGLDKEWKHIKEENR